VKTTTCVSLRDINIIKTAYVGSTCKKKVPACITPWFYVIRTASNYQGRIIVEYGVFYCPNAALVESDTSAVAPCIRSPVQCTVPIVSQFKNVVSQFPIRPLREACLCGLCAGRAFFVAATLIRPCVCCYSVVLTRCCRRRCS
jgi:hypothetical protein